MSTQYRELRNENDQLKARIGSLEGALESVIASLSLVLGYSKESDAEPEKLQGESVMMDSVAEQTSDLENAARAVASKLSSRSGVAKAFDPAMLVSIMQVIASLFGGCQNRQSPAAVIERARKRGLLDRFIVNRHARRSMSRRDFQAYGAEVVEAIFEAGGEQTTNQLARLMDSIAADPESGLD